MKFVSRYAYFFQNNQNIFGKSLILLKSVYGMTNSWRLFTDELTKWQFEAGFVQYQFLISFYYKYAQDGKQL